MTVRIVIADDHGVLRAGLRALLHGVSGIEVVAEASNGEEAIRLAGELHPDLVLLDITMPDINGIDVTRQLMEENPNMKVLIITMHEDTALLREALVAGASGYLIKRAADAELIAAIQAVMRGELYVHPALTRHLLQGLTAPPAMKEAEPLSPREIEVLRLLAAGYTNRQIAEMLSLSVRTVESHRATISEKLNLRTRADLAQYASEHGLLRPGK